MKKVVIAGGTGHLGVALAEHFVTAGNEVTVLTRRYPGSIVKGVHYILWDGIHTGEWSNSIDGSDIVINMCGKPVACRYTQRNKRELIRSRTETTTLIGQAIQQSSLPPSLWINASSSAYYGFSDASKDERDEAGHDFPARICVEWEDAFWNVPVSKTRKIAWRLGVVLQRNRGLILPFQNLVKSYVGGRLGSGKQLFTWIHEDDFLRAAQWTIETPGTNGVYNITSPEPVTNAQFMASLRKVMNYKVYFALPSWLLYLGGHITGIEPSLVLKGRSVLPGRLLQGGFTFRFGGIEPALQELFNKARNGF